MNKLYPTNYKTFIKWIMSDKSRENIYKRLLYPKPFDVTLRDGLQNLSKEQENIYTTNKKREIYATVWNTHNVYNTEIGSVVSNRVLPIFSDTVELFNYVEDCPINNYILFPSKEKLLKTIYDVNITNFSFITSVSNSFQLKNTKMNVNDNYSQLKFMIDIIENKNIYNKTPINIKLYVSCINECPIEGKIDNDYIIKNILELNKLNVTNICLSDTCGTLCADDFEYIVDTCNIFGIPFSKFSLHLHVKQDRINDVKQIFFKALDRKINCFDVALLNTGGCSVTMSKKDIAPNLSYELYYKFMVDYIDMQTSDINVI
jgi:hypothetical protein